MDRPFDLRGWASTWRLLAVTMPLTIAITAALGRWVLGTLTATAVLLGAVIAPTDPVLASDVQASPPTEESGEEIDPREAEGTIRFALTSEAGLNDGLAFPFTFLALAIAAASGTSSVTWIGEWVLVDLFYKVAVGVVVGFAGGKVLAWMIFSRPATTDLARAMRGSEALAATLITYGATELLFGYGFIAVFVGALTVRHHEWEHEYHRVLHDFAVMVERLFMAAVLFLFGGALAGGLLSPLTWTHLVVALLVVFVVRPVAGLVGMIGFPASWNERLVVAAFGIRGIGSFYYLSFALNEATFQEAELVVAAEELWGVVGLVVVISIVVHGVAASPIMDELDRLREDHDVQDRGDVSSG